MRRIRVGQTLHTIAQPSITSVSVYNEWSQIQDMILGIASPIYFPRSKIFVPPGSGPIWLSALDRLLGHFFVGRRAPRWLNGAYKTELDSLHQTLRNEGVRVFRPDPITPFPNEEPGLSQVFARDPIIAVGKKMICSHQELKTLRKEIRGFTAILKGLETSGVEITRMPEKLEDAFLEGGDVLVDAPYVYVGVGELASNHKGAEWLQGALGKEFQVIPVPIAQPGIFHLDTCMTLIGPKQGIICRSALAHPLPAPLRDYEFIEVDETVRRQIGTNVLVVNPRTIIMQSRHKQLRTALQKKGFKVIDLPFRWHALAGGAFRCATHPLRRAGS